MGTNQAIGNALAPRPKKPQAPSPEKPVVKIFTREFPQGIEVQNLIFFTKKQLRWWIFWATIAFFLAVVAGHIVGINACNTTGIEWMCYSHGK